MTESEFFVPNRYLILASSAAALATALLVALAPRLRWTDTPTDAERARKLQDRPVPTVGGTALVVAVLVAMWAWSCEGFFPYDERLWGAAAPIALGLAFLTGLADDLLPGGLRVRPKLALQALAASPLAYVMLADRGLEAGAVLPLRPTAVLAAGAVFFFALLAMNAINFFDNADGAAGGLGALTFCVVSPLVGWTFLGFLPFNLVRRTRTAPWAYLGDSGSHALGMLVFLNVPAWPALALPLCDAVGTCVIRLRAGAPVWRADRLHLAHRLERRGLHRGLVLGVLLAIATPSVLLGGWGVASRAFPAVAAGVGLTVVLYLAALAWTAGERQNT